MRRNLNRRDFLKLAGVGVVGLYAATRQEPARSLIYGPNINRIPSEVPPQLAHLEIPRSNENLTPAHVVVEKGLEIYAGWQKQDARLPASFYRRPDDYTDNIDLFRSIFEKSEYYDGFNPVERVGVNWNSHKIALFTRNTINSIVDVLQTDPGSGFYDECMRVIKLRKGEDYEVPIVEHGIKLFDEVDHQQAQDIMISRLGDCVKSITHGIHPTSTAIPFAYYLYQIRGNIVKSVLDNALFLKLICRNNLTTLEFQPTMESAELLNKLFVDEFSTSVPLTWLIQNVQQNDEVLTYPTNDKYWEYKDYMPINRANYHPWMIIAQSMWSTPAVTEESIRYYYSDVEGNRAHGQIKAESDLLVASDASALTRIWEQYEGKE